MEQKHTKTILVVNPSSASGATGKGWEDLYLKIKETFSESPEVVFTKKSGDGTRITRTFLKKGFKQVVAIDGDGTINEVANGFFRVKREWKGKQNTSNANNNLQTLNSGRNGIYNNKVPNSPTISPISPGAIMVNLFILCSCVGSR